MCCPGRVTTHSEFKLLGAGRMMLPKNSYCPPKFNLHHIVRAIFPPKNPKTTSCIILGGWEAPQKSNLVILGEQYLQKSNFVILGEQRSQKNWISFSWNYDISQRKLHHPGRTMIPKTWATASWTPLAPPCGPAPYQGKWGSVEILSPGFSEPSSLSPTCPCSQRVMTHKYLTHYYSVS